MGKPWETMGNYGKTMGKSLGKVWEINGNMDKGFHGMKTWKIVVIFVVNNSGESPWDIIGIVLSYGAAGILSKRFMFFVLLMGHV